MIKYSIPLIFLLAACSGIRPRYHVVAAGETLSKLAAEYGIPVESLRDSNEGLLAGGLQPGLKLYVPFEDNPSWDEPDLDRTPSGEALAFDLENAHFSWPVRGAISSFYGTRKRHGRSRKHEGIDIAANRGTPIRSARSGHVIYADSKLSGYGRMVIVRHADSFSTVYAHLSKFDVKKGQFVARGQVVGRVGRSGRATGYHLHFEVRNDKRAVDPLLYLERRVAAK